MTGEKEEEEEQGREEDNEEEDLIALPFTHHYGLCFPGKITRSFQFIELTSYKKCL